MTEDDRLTILRFAAIERGAAKGIPRFKRLQDHLWIELPLPVLLTMRALALALGEDLPHEEACRAVAGELAKIEAGARLMTYDDPPKFIRRQRATS